MKGNRRWDVSIKLELEQALEASYRSSSQERDVICNTSNEKYYHRLVKTYLNCIQRGIRAVVYQA